MAATTALYTFEADCNSICQAARRELIPRGYTELTSPLDSTGPGQRVDPSDRATSVAFQKQGVGTAIQILIVPLTSDVRPPGTIPGSERLDWVTILVEQRDLKLPLTWKLHYRWNNLWGKPMPPRPTPKPPPPASTTSPQP